MAVTQHASASAPSALTLDTETFLGTDPDTTAGAFQFVVDVNAMARIDRLVIRLYEKTTGSGDTARMFLEIVLTNEQQERLWVSPCFLLLNGWRFSLEQTDGTGRSFPWSIRKAA